MLKCDATRTQFVQARGTIASTHAISFPRTRSHSGERESSPKLRWTTKSLHTFRATSPIQCLDWDAGGSDMIALGHQDGTVDIHLASEATPVTQIAARQQRSCSCVRFNSTNLIAIGLDKVRNDACLTIYDVKAQSPFSLFANSEGVSSLAWTTDGPHNLVAGLNYRWLRMFDIRMDPKDSINALSIPTKAVYEIAVDPTDSKCFASTHNNEVLIWDQRKADLPCLTLKAGNGKQGSHVNQIRFRPHERHHLAVMSDDGKMNLWHLDAAISDPESFRVMTHSEHSESDAIAFDFIEAPDALRSCWNAVVLSGSSEESAVRSINSRPIVAGYTSMSDFVCLDEGRLAFDRSLVRGIVQDDLGLAALPQYKSEEDDQDLDESTSEELRREAPFSRSLSTQLSNSRCINSPPQTPTQDVDYEADLGDISHSTYFDISCTMYRRALCGYGMDASLNFELIVEDFPSLKTVWKWLAWSTRASTEGKLQADDFDFALEGCLNVWKGIGGSPKRPMPPYSDLFYKAVQKINHNFPIDIFPQNLSEASLRQLTLTSMGWCVTTAELDEFQAELVASGNTAKAAFYSMSQKENIDEAIEILEAAGVQMAAAVLDYTRSRGDDEAMRAWRRSCVDRGVKLESPYVRAIFAYLSARDWRDVIDEQGLTLRERVALSIRYIGESEVMPILEDLCRTELAEGNLEGLLLTGINHESLDLLQNYVDRTGDVQTAALIGSFKTDLRDDKRVIHWISEYRNLLNTWGLYLIRCRFDLARNQLGKRERSDRTSPRQVCIRCNHCNAVIGSPLLPNGAKLAEAGPTHANGSTDGARKACKVTICPNCRKPLPKCVLCLLPIGSESILNFCLTCNHTLHSRHANAWFSRHKECPAPSCACQCRVIDPVRTKPM